MTLDRAAVKRAMATILPMVPEGEMRLVGSASSVLRGIKLPAADIDILFRDRADVDAWFAALRAAHHVETAPEWLPDTNQYFARISTDGIAVELSTVELDGDTDTAECFGVGPWRHFDRITWGEESVPAVATELRLMTEFARGREDRAAVIIEFLKSTACDLPLVRRGLANLGATADAIDRVVSALSAPRSV